MTYFEQILAASDEDKLALAQSEGFTGGIDEINAWLEQAIAREKQELEDARNETE